MNRPSFNRRTFLKGSGVCIFLPYLESVAVEKQNDIGKQRFLCVANPFGMIHDAFFPSEKGLHAKLPMNIDPLEPLRGKFTVFSNLDHGQSGGHSATHAFLSGVRTIEASSMPNGNITLDQFLAEQIGSLTRFPVLNTSAGEQSGGEVQLSWTRSGVMVPPIKKVSQVFKVLFADESQAKKAKITRKMHNDGSILDTVNEQAKVLNRRLDKYDKDKMAQYFTSVREVEKRLQQEIEWVNKPKAKVTYNEPKDGKATHQLPILFDLMALAFQTDSTRVATIEIPGGFDAAGVGIKSQGYHAYSHHGKDPTLMAGMRKIENFQIKELSRFLQKLEDMKLLDSTQVLFGSGMSDGSAHTNKNLPLILAGGKHKHKTHIESSSTHKIPLSNLFLSVAQDFGLEVDSFGQSNGTLSI
ncbi:MAG: DUF1552 domain-containing protein [Lentisphaeraceae bacterium]|nr:DUF1552 domain-containing protein [Lentisphaeraceae bacterium]